MSVKSVELEEASLSQENGHNGKVSFDSLELEEATLSQENGHNGKVSFDSLELEKVTLIFPVEEDQAVAQPAVDDLEIRPQENGHNGKVSFDSLELEKVTLIFPVEEDQAVAQPATDEQFDVMRYAQWLSTEAKRNNNGSHLEETNDNTKTALKTVT